MSEKTLRVRLPALPDPSLFNDPTHTIATADGRALLTYDPETRAAFIYECAQMRWTIAAPVEFEEFIVLAAFAGHQVADSEDARRWLAAGMRRADSAGVH